MRYYRRDPIDPGTRLSKGTIRRVWAFARRYRTQIAIFLASIGLSSLVGVVPPLLVRTLLNDALPPLHHNGRLVNLVGLPGTTSWTDTNAPVSSPRFYQLRVSR